MSYTYKVKVKKNYLNKWVILSSSDRVLFELKAASEHAALEEARAFMSSWDSVLIEVESEKRD